jgi:uncharacterized lipoprotein YajG
VKTIIGKKNKHNMKKILLVLTLMGIFTGCGNGGESSTDSDSTANINSTTPPATSDTTNPVGVMMGDTSIVAADSLVGGDSLVVSDTLE